MMIHIYLDDTKIHYYYKPCLPKVCNVVELFALKTWNFETGCVLR